MWGQGGEEAQAEEKAGEGEGWVGCGVKGRPHYLRPGVPEDPDEPLDLNLRHKAQ